MRGGVTMRNMYFIRIDGERIEKGGTIQEQVKELEKKNNWIWQGIDAERNMLVFTGMSY